MRAIDGDALKRKMQRVATEAWKMKITAKVETIMNQFIDFIEEQPTIEPERKKGKWIDDCTCSSCYWTHEDSNGFALLTHYSFCPNCGADMREGEIDD